MIAIYYKAIGELVDQGKGWVFRDVGELFRLFIALFGAARINKEVLEAKADNI